MTDNNEPAFDMRQDGEGWTVFVTATGEPALIDGVPQTGLDVQDADVMTEALNILQERRGKAGS